MYFRNFVIISPLNRARPFISTNLNSLHPKMLFFQFFWNWFTFSGEEDFFNLSMYFCNFVITSPWKGRGPSFEQTWIFFTKGYFMPSFLEIVPLVLKKMIFQLCQCILAILKLSPLGKERGPSFEQTWIPFTQRWFVFSLVEIDPVVLEKKMKMWKVNDNDNDDDDDDGQRTNFDQKSSLEPSAQVS